MSDVSDLLTQSRAAHLAMKGTLPTRNPDGTKTAGEPSDTHRLLALALDLREQAHAADPDHLDEGWRADVVDHIDLVEFYCRASESWPK